MWVLPTSSIFSANAVISLFVSHVHLLPIFCVLLQDYSCLNTFALGVLSAQQGLPVIYVADDFSLKSSLNCLCFWEDFYTSPTYVVPQSLSVAMEFFNFFPQHFHIFLFICLALNFSKQSVSPMGVSILPASSMLK